MNAPTDTQLQLQRTLEINGAIRRGFAAVRHHKKLTSRLCDAIKAELPKDGTSWYCVLDTSGSSSFRIRVMGTPPAAASRKHEDYAYHCPLSNATLYNTRPPYRALTWQEGLDYELDRNDNSDSLQWAAMMQEKHVTFQAMHDRVADLQRQIDALRFDAQVIVNDMPPPAAAKVRKEKHFWNRPDADTVAAFPNLFPSKA